MSKKICVVGTGYVGLVAAVGLSDFGNSIIGVDIDKSKVDMLNQGQSPIYEPGIDEYLNRNLNSKRLEFSNDISYGVKESEVIFIAVGTPPKQNGEADLQYVFKVADSIGENLNNYKVIVTKSTVPVGTNAAIRDRLISKFNYEPGKDFDVVSNPEFLREGKATQDFFHPDRTVIGYEHGRAKDVMFEVYRSLNLISVPFVWCSLETAELIKYASNAFLATKITFINEMANLSDAVGADIHVIAKSMGMDGRISPKFLHPGPGYGGSCFPKDTKAVASTADAYGVKMDLIKQVIVSNDNQREVIIRKLVGLLGGKDVSVLKNKKIAMLGLAFKQETDDIRESPAIEIAMKLLEEGANVSAYDPKAMANAKKEEPSIEMAVDSYATMEKADALLLMTEWNEFRNLDLQRIKFLLENPVIVDARNLLNASEAVALGFKYQGVGRGSLINNEGI